MSGLLLALILFAAPTVSLPAEIFADGFETGDTSRWGEACPAVLCSSSLPAATCAEYLERPDCWCRELRLTCGGGCGSSPVEPCACVKLVGFCDGDP